MKTSAIIRIIAWSVIAIFLTVVLVNVINGNGMNLGALRGFNINFSGYSFENINKYSVAEDTVNVKDIKNIDIDWISGKVRIEEYDGDSIQFYEESSSNLSEDNKMRYLAENGTLKIKFKKPYKSIISFNNYLNKTLVIRMPSSGENNLNEFTLDVVSASVEIDALKADKVSIEAVSGDITIKNLISDKLDVETVSGDMNVHANVDSVDFESVSGDLVLDLENCPRGIDAEAVSGRVDIFLPENDGFTVRYDSVSGKFKCDFEVSITKKEAVYKNGKAKFDIETVSGGINVNRK